MIRRRLPRARTRDPVPIAGIVGVLCGLGVLASGLGSAEAGFGTVQPQVARPADGTPPHVAQSPAWVCSDTASIRPVSPCNAGVEADVRDDRGTRVRPPPAEQPFSTGDDPGRPMSAKHRATSGVRAQVMGAANFARHRVEPGLWTTRDEPEPPLRYGDQ